MAEYTGAPYAISCDSCTDAIFLCCKYLEVQGSTITIPARTYISPPQSILQAGAKVEFEDIEWTGIYQLKPFPIYDAAKRLTSGMYVPGSYMCLSFHHKKPLPIGKGGMILTDDEKALNKIKRLRYEGRNISIPFQDDDLGDGGWNMYMTPEQAARGLTLLNCHPQNFEDIKEDPPYPDLRKYNLFKQ